MKLILCTLLGFGILTGGITALLSTLYGMGRIYLWKLGDCRCCPKPLNKADIIGHGIVPAFLLSITISISYLIGKGICQ